MKFTIWITGLPASGKTTLATLLKEYFEKIKLQSIILDGDEMRKTISKDLGFSPEDRTEHNRRVIEVAKLLSKNGIIVIVPLISPYRKTRKYARQEIPNFVEIYLKTSLEECMRRDPKGLYKKAKAGEIQNLTGLQSIYEEPENPEIVMDTGKYSREECLKIVLSKLHDLGYLQNYL